MKILGLWSGHDASYCVLDEGRVTEHVEWERHIREKEPAGDSAEIFSTLNGNINGLAGIATVHKAERLTQERGWQKLAATGVPLSVYGHHQAHAANAFYSSNFDKAIVVTIDGGGIESAAGIPVAASIWEGKGNKLHNHELIPDYRLNIGGVWTRVTRYVFRYESGWPQGHQAGTVMALAALGDPTIWSKDVARWFSEDHQQVLQTPVGHVRGMSAKDPRSPKHPYLYKYEQIAEANDQEKYNLAASLQQITETHIFMIIKRALEYCPGAEYLCVSGGVALNSVAMGKLWSTFPQLKGIYIPPVPYDGGLCIGAAQYHWHHVMERPRVKWEDNATPYLGLTYPENIIDDSVHRMTLDDALSDTSTGLDYRGGVCINQIIDLLDDGKIIAVFNGRAESGRRALGNRSILADPRKPDMKDRVNRKVKHRQWFRPFAPSIRREDVADWFTCDVDSPYMSFVVSFKPEKTSEVPAVVHFDGSARLQTVTAKDNPWYHDLLTRWKTKTGVPIILNTSFNDREPICETPDHALKCFMGTDIDHLYFPETKTLVSKRQAQG